jgi:hypothetical protein
MRSGFRENALLRSGSDLMIAENDTEPCKARLEVHSFVSLTAILRDHRTTAHRKWPRKVTARCGAVLALPARPSLTWPWLQRSVGGTVLVLRTACRPRFTAARPDCRPDANHQQVVTQTP